MRLNAVSPSHVYYARRAPWLPAALVAGLLSGQVFAASDIAVWDGGTGNWSNAANWSPALVPDNGNNGAGSTFEVRIDNGDGSTNSVVTLDVGQTIESLTVDTGDSLDFNSGNSLTVGSAGPPSTGFVVNNGAIKLNGSGSVTELQLQGGIGLTGVGTLSLGASPLNRLTTDGSDMLHGAGHTIRGGGSVLDDTGGMTNEGAIIADSTSAMMLRPGDAGLLNSGVIRAEGSGGMRLREGVYTNTPTGAMEVADGSAIDLEFGVTIAGGTLSTTGGGVVRASNATLSGVSIAAGSLVQQINSEAPRVTGGLTNDGTWEINSNVFSFTTLTFEGDVTLDGTGRIDTNSSFSGVNNSRIVTDGGVLTQAAGHTIEGAGALLDDTGGMVNHGTIIANENEALVIRPGDAGLLNSGVIRAEGSGGMRLREGVYTNTPTGAMEVADGSAIDLEFGVTIAGGTLSTTGGGVVRASNATLSGVSIAAGSLVQQINSEAPRVTGGLTNDGTWEINSNVFSFTTLTFEGDVTLDGTGRIDTNSSFSGVNNSRIVTDGGVLTQAAGHTIEGAGALLDDTGGMVNHGTIIANENEALVIRPGDAGLLNSGVIRAEGSGGMRLREGVYTNTPTGAMEVADGSAIDLEFGVTIAGGTLSTTGGGVVRASNATLSGVSIAAGSLVQQINSEAPRVTGGLTNDGTWEINSNVFSFTTLTFEGDVTLDGTGRIDTNSSFSGVNNSRIVTDGGVLTQAAGHTIEGAGALLDDTGGMVNLGTVQGNEDVALTVDAAAGMSFDNRGLVLASDGGKVAFVDSAEVANVSGNTLTGGTWNVIQNAGGTTRIDLGSGSNAADITTSNASVTLSGVNSEFDAISGLANNQGSFNLAAGRNFDTAGTLANTGEINVTGAGTALNVGGGENYEQTAGTTTLTDASLNAVEVNISGGLLTGAGTVGGNLNVTGAGTVATGFLTGILEVADDFSLSGNWDVELGGPSALAPIEFDQVVVGGIATFASGASIDVSLIDGFVPVAGNTFDLLTARSIVNDTGGDISSIFDFTAAALDLAFAYDVQLVDTSADMRSDTLRLLIERVAATGVPAPATLLLALAGLGLLLAWRRVRPAGA